MMIKELTASVFIVRQHDAGAWQTGLIWHPRLECRLPAGGHVESGETTARAAVRQAAEFPVKKKMGHFVARCPG